MKTAIIVHGWPGKEEFFDPTTSSPSNNQWFPWLQKQLSLKNITAQTPEMTDAWNPEYEKWKGVFEQFHLDEETVLVGHSLGAGFLVRYLSENDVNVGQLILVAPWIDPEKELSGFFNFKFDENLSKKTKEGIALFYSTDDDKEILQSVEVLKKIHDIQIREFHDKGHFCISDGVLEFPELLEEIK